MEEQFLQFIETSLRQIQLHKQIAAGCGVSDDMIELHNKLINYCNQLKEIVQNTKLAPNYVSLFQNDISNTLGNLPYRGHENIQFLQSRNNKERCKVNIENIKNNLAELLKHIVFNLDFFQKLKFFNNNIVAVGANGSGKTTLSNKLKQYLPNSGVVIAAQKILIIPTFSSISNQNQTSQKLQQTQVADKSLKVTYSTENRNDAYRLLVHLGDEFKILLDNLLADRNANRNKFCDAFQKGDRNPTLLETKLDMVLKIWNSLIQHRVLECNDGINLTLQTIDKTSSYPVHQMSDGEKVALYLIAQVLQAPQNGFIIIDEPEMFLHKTILKKLWDRLEQERRDCIFVYLTHDLDFTTSRIAKKIWIKSYTPPDNWEIENIPENDLPETLLLELLGSRKTILFCEGKKDGIDEKIYNCLFPEYTVTPVKGCFDVINYTKVFNKIKNATTKAIGIIDTDHHNRDRLSALESENIFALDVAEIENLLLDEEFLRLVAKEFKVVEEKAVDDIIQGIMYQFKQDIELQVSNYVSAKIDYYFKDSNLKKGNSQEDIENNYTKFVEKIQIPDWFSQRKAELVQIIDSNDYKKMIFTYNNKGLKAIVQKHFKISDYMDRAIKFLQSNKEAQNIIRNHLPQKIINYTTN